MERLSDKFPDILEDKNVDKSIVSEYLLSEDTIVFNDGDDDMHPIRVALPEMPHPREVDGYGDKIDDQVVKKVEIPKKLRTLVRNSTTISSVWETIDKNRKHYREEIYFIKREWDRILSGYWCFINGVPTFIPGAHHFYLNYWNLDDGLPEYRYRDRLFFLFADFCNNDTTAWYPYRVKDEALNNYRYFPKIDKAKKYANRTNAEIESGSFVVDLGVRTCLGFTYAKHRREGATFKAQCYNYWVTFVLEMAHSGIQSMDETSAKNAFRDKLISPFKKLPFFLKPEHKGNTDPAKILEFDYAPQNIGARGSMAATRVGLESKIDYRSQGVGQYDGNKLRYYHGDEVGKTKLTDVYRRHNIVAKALKQGKEIVGFAIYTSTVGQMAKEGGSRFKALCMASKWEDRDGVTGMTATGLYNLFIPAYINLQGYTDKFGNPVIDDAKTEAEAKKRGYVFGAKTYLLSEREQVEDDPVSLNEKIRMHPIAFRECFLRSAKNSSFNLTKLHNRLNEFDMNPELMPISANLDWTDGFGSHVKRSEGDSGKFMMSYIPDNPNRKMKRGEHYMPIQPFQFRASADPYKTERSGSTKALSNGGGAVFMMRDSTIDPDEKPVEEWLTHRFVCTYNHRPKTKKEYAEDMLKMCIYYNALIFPERNVSFVVDMFREWGYGGYLMYAKSKNKKQLEPGFYTNSETQQDIFSQLRDYVEIHSERDMHPELLEEISEIDGYDDMTNYDLFTAAGGCLISMLYDNVDSSAYEEDMDMSIDDIMPGRRV